MPIVRQALQAKTGRGARVSQPFQLPAPVKGWNTRDPLVAMDPGYAILLDNWWPDSDGVKKRSGSAIACTFSGETPKRLRALEAGSVSKMLAFSQTTIWDATGTTPTSLATGMNSFDWDTAVFANRVIMVNGVDTERQWDGTALTALSFTGHPAGAPFVGCHGHKSRMYYWQANALEFYYTTGAGTFQGAVASFPLQYVVSAGGSIVAMASWSVYGGNDTTSDMLAIFLSSGEVVIYAGSDPGGTDFALQSHFHMAPILGRRTVPKYGGDVMMGTVDGFFPLSKAIALGGLTDSISISDAIQPSVKRAANFVGASPYWSSALYTSGDSDGKGGMLIYNIPAGTSSASGSEVAYQFVMNTRTGAWARFSGMNAYDWTIWKGQPYFAAVGGIYQANTGLADGTAPIACTGMQAYSNLGAPGFQKMLKFARAYVSSDGDIPITLGVGIDFAQLPVMTATISTAGGGTPWDVGTWDLAEWAASVGVSKQWQTVPGLGEFFAVAMQITTGVQDATWYSTGLLYELGTML